MPGSGENRRKGCIICVTPATLALCSWTGPDPELASGILGSAMNDSLGMIERAGLRHRICSYA
jgi:hypothetical protein